MKFIIPIDRSLSIETIKEFCNLYYPEMPTGTGPSFSGKYIYLQKNPWVCAFFYVKHKEKKGETHITMQRNGNTMARIIGGVLLNYIIAGDFYTEVRQKFEQFLHDRGVEQVVQKENYASLAKGRVWKVVGAFLVANLLALLLTVLLGWWSKENSQHYPTYTETYEYAESVTDYFDDDSVVSSSDYWDDEYGDLESDDGQMYQLIHKPTGKVVFESHTDIVFDYNDEVEGHALINIYDYDKQTYKAYIFDTRGDERVLCEDCDWAFFLDDGVILVRDHDYNTHYVDYEGNPVSNWTTFSYEYMNIICIVLMAFFFIAANVVCWLIVRRKGKKDPEPLTVTGTAIADAEATNVAN